MTKLPKKPKKNLTDSRQIIIFHINILCLQGLQSTAASQKFTCLFFPSFANNRDKVKTIENCQWMSRIEKLVGGFPDLRLN